MSEPKPLTTTPDLIAAAAILEAAYHSKHPGFLPLLTAQVFAAAVLSEDFGIIDMEDNPEAANAAFKAFVLALKDPMHPDLDRFRDDPEAAEASRKGASPMPPAQEAAAPAVKVKSSDLKVAVKHAFIAGRVSAGGSSSFIDDAWSEYDPTESGGYARILAALEGGE